MCWKHSSCLLLKASSSTVSYPDISFIHTRNLSNEPTEDKSSCLSKFLRHPHCSSTTPRHNNSFSHLHVDNVRNTLTPVQSPVCISTLIRIRCCRAAAYLCLQKRREGVTKTHMDTKQSRRHFWSTISFSVEPESLLPCGTRVCVQPTVIKMMKGSQGLSG